MSSHRSVATSPREVICNAAYLTTSGHAPHSARLSAGVVAAKGCGCRGTWATPAAGLLRGRGPARSSGLALCRPARRYRSRRCRALAGRSCRRRHTRLGSRRVHVPRADRGVLRQPHDLPAVPAREPPPQPCHPHSRRHPDPPAPVGCQYSVMAVDLRHLEPAEVVTAHSRPLFPRASGITEGTQKDHRGVHERSLQGPRSLRARRGGSYGPCRPLEQLLRGGPRTAVNQLPSCRDPPSIVV